MYLLIRDEEEQDIVPPRWRAMEAWGVIGVLNASCIRFCCAPREYCQSNCQERVGSRHLSKLATCLSREEVEFGTHVGSFLRLISTSF
jgi:hypothetical protein